MLPDIKISKNGQIKTLPLQITLPLYNIGGVIVNFTISSLKIIYEKKYILQIQSD